MKTVVITGGSSGIGKEIAQYFSLNEYKVYELSRSGISTNKIIHLDCDITDQKAIEESINYIINDSGRIDILINNAGFGISGAIEYTNLEDVKKQFDVNFFGAVRVIKESLPVLRKNKGRIVNVSSVGGIFALPYQAFYSASKFALNGYTLALSNEIKRFGVSSCVVMPGDTKTNFTQKRLKNELGQNVYGNSIEKSISIMEKDEQKGMMASKVGKRIYKIAIKRKIKPTYVIGTKYKLFSVLQKILPIRLVNYLVGKIYAK